MSILLDAFKLKPMAALKFLRAKGMATSFHWYDMWQEAHDKAFTVAKAMDADVLQDIRSMVDKAVAEGITFQQFKRELTPRLQARGWWGKKEMVDPSTGKTIEVQLGSPARLKTIFQTNMNTSYAAGHWRRQAAHAKRRPYLQFQAVLDSRTRPEHRALDGKVFPIEDTFWKTHYPPLGYNCRCSVVSLSKYDIDESNTPVEKSGANLVERTVVVGRGDDIRDAHVTGYKTTNAEGQPVTVWTDPGFDYNPGRKDWEPDLTKYDSDIAKAYRQMQRKQSIKR